MFKIAVRHAKMNTAQPLHTACGGQRFTQFTSTKGYIVATRKTNRTTTANENPDPITGTPGSHPVATGVGTAVGGAAAGAAAGAIGGPVGAVVGAVVGGVAGGGVGAMVGEELDTNEEDNYWREQYPSRPYYSEDFSYDEISPAYRYGWESRMRSNQASFASTEDELKAGWEETKHDVRLGWEQARAAVQDSWDHADERIQRKPR